MAANARKEKATDWAAPQLMEAILTQILAAGIDAFMTQKANIKANATLGIAARTYNQKDVWMKAPDGIIPCLQRHPLKLFANVIWPQEAHTALLQAVNRYLAVNRNLYTEGMEQAEDAEAGTTGTKDESLTTLQQAVIDVAALKAAAAEQTQKNASDKHDAADLNGAGAKYHQDQVSSGLGLRCMHRGSSRV